MLLLELLPCCNYLLALGRRQELHAICVVVCGVNDHLCPAHRRARYVAQQNAADKTKTRAKVGVVYLADALLVCCHALLIRRHKNLLVEG